MGSENEQRQPAVARERVTEALDRPIFGIARLLFAPQPCRTIN
jgi:hypothetical protein